MRYNYSRTLLEDVSSSVKAAFTSAGIVNISVVAEQIRLRNLAENVALEDVEHLVLQAAQLLGAAIEFDVLPEGHDHSPLNGDGRKPSDPPYSTSVQ
ncbi:hypothetical protein [Mesorhizobium sp. ES1-1]|uniref:hypothetical protein n=1 Tax=Mesorhizobium sp. ES1-1 TaxID=2876629 RepID=UPI001CCDE977|nr:hypothetical protein [Mesorhizobium sp. ES1-1]MBZ9675693.1 hypothetical protein [Mesorhizobium sp. ES1-1]